MSKRTPRRDAMWGVRRVYKVKEQSMNRRAVDKWRNNPRAEVRSTSGRGQEIAEWNYTVRKSASVIGGNQEIGNSRQRLPAE